MSYRLRELAERVGGEIRGDGDCRISGVHTLTQAGEGHISFLSQSRYRKHLATTAASAVLVTAADAEHCPVNAVVVNDPYVAYARIAALFAPAPAHATGIHTSAHVDAEAQVDASAWIGPQAVIEAGAVIGPGVRVGPGCVVGRGAAIGADSTLTANVTVCHEVQIGARALIHPGAVIGSDGFGLANDRGTWIKVPQLGAVRVGDDVEIGANTTIDRGAIEDTVIEDGVKLDNQVHIAHNVRIGAHTVIAGCTGIAGSTTVGKHCAMGGAVAISGHLTITDNVQITGMAMVTKSITESGVYSSGLPAEPNAEWHRQVAHVRRLESMARKLKALEKAVNIREEG